MGTALYILGALLVGLGGLLVGIGVHFLPASPSACRKTREAYEGLASRVNGLEERVVAAVEANVGDRLAAIEAHLPRLEGVEDVAARQRADAIALRELVETTIAEVGDPLMQVVADGAEDRVRLWQRAETLEAVIDWLADAVGPGLSGPPVPPREEWPEPSEEPEE